MRRWFRSKLSLAVLLSVTALCGAFQDGDYVPVARRGQFSKVAPISTLCMSRPPPWRPRAMANIADAVSKLLSPKQGLCAGADELA